MTANLTADERAYRVDVILRAMGTVCHNRRASAIEIAEHANLTPRNIGGDLLFLIKERLVYREAADKTFFPTRGGWERIQDLINNAVPDTKPIEEMFVVVSLKSDVKTTFVSLEEAERHAKMPSGQTNVNAFTIYEHFTSRCISRWHKGVRLPPDA